mgnify:CR=1 FL=1
MTLQTWWMLCEEETDPDLGGAVPSVLQHLSNPPAGMVMGSQPWLASTKFLVALSFDQTVADPGEVATLVQTLEAVADSDLFVFGEGSELETTLANWPKQSAWATVSVGLGVPSQNSWTVNTLLWSIISILFPGQPTNGIHFGAEGVTP